MSQTHLREPGVGKGREEPVVLLGVASPRKRDQWEAVELRGANRPLAGEAMTARERDAHGLADHDHGLDPRFGRLSADERDVDIVPERAVAPCAQRRDDHVDAGGLAGAAGQEGRDEPRRERRGDADAYLAPLAALELIHRRSRAVQAPEHGPRLSEHEAPRVRELDAPVRPLEQP